MTDIHKERKETKNHKKIVNCKNLPRSRQQRQNGWCPNDKLVWDSVRIKKKKKNQWLCWSMTKKIHLSHNRQLSSDESKCQGIIKKFSDNTHPPPTTRLACQCRRSLSLSAIWVSSAQHQCRDHVFKVPHKTNSRILWAAADQKWWLMRIAKTNGHSWLLKPAHLPELDIILGYLSNCWTLNNIYLRFSFMSVLLFHRLNWKTANIIHKKF